MKQCNIDKDGKTKDLETMERTIRDFISKTYKPSFSSRLNDFITGFFIVSFLLLVLGLVLTLGIILIENPVSLAIVIGTILLIIMWSKKK